MESYGQTPPGYEAPAGPGYDASAGIDKEQANWAMAAHLVSLLGFTAIPFANILGPLVVWLMKKDTMPLVDDQGREAINFQISVLIYGILCFLLSFVIVGFILAPALLVFDIVYTILAAISAQKGIAYRYPLTIRIL